MESYHGKLITQNGVYTTNIDEARNYLFNAGMRDGISKGILNEGTFTVLESNVIYFDTCELRVGGHRYLLDEAYQYSFSSYPSVATRYALVATVVVDNNENVTFTLGIQDASTPLVKNKLYEHLNGAGTYQVEIGRFTLTTNGTIADVKRTLDLITGGSSGMGEHFIAGNITTTMLESGMQANVTAEDIYDANGNYVQTNFHFDIPETAGTVVTVNDVEQANLGFESDPQTQLNNKVDKETGKGLSENDYTTEEKTKLSGIEAEANKTIVDSALSSTSENPVQNKVVNDALDTKADANTVYTKTEIDGLIMPTSYTELTYNSTYVNDNAYQKSYYYKIGNVAFVHINNISFKAVAQQNGDVLFSNLPRPANIVGNGEYVFILSSTVKQARVVISANTTQLKNYYDSYTPNASVPFSAVLIYPTID